MNRNTIIVIVAAIAVAAITFSLLKKDPSSATPAASSTTQTLPPRVPPNPAALAPDPLPAPSGAYTIDPAQVHPMMESAPLDMATVALEAKMITNAQQLLADGKPREALKQIQDYELIPDRAALVPEAKFLKIAALAKVGGHKADALALAMLARGEPEMADYQSRIDTILADAGASAGTTFASP